LGKLFGRKKETIFRRSFIEGGVFV